jgi:adenylate cyclase
MIGTPPYMSPEQIRGQPTDQRTDVWAFGCVIYELLCGRQAFGRSTVPDTIADILQTEPDWSALPARVPADVRRLLRRCLEKDPSRRWQDFGEIRTELARAISAVGGREHERPWLALLLFALPVGVIALLALGRPDYLTPLEYSAYDSILRWSARLPPDRRVVIVDVDERSLAAIGRWPWRRDVIGRLVERLRDLGATTIALDMFFSEPDESSPIGPTGGASVRTRTPDELLADSLRGGRVVLGYGMTFDASAEPADDCKLHPLNLAISTSDETPRSTGAPFFEATGSLCNLESLAMAAGQSGFLNGTPDPDGILRRAPVAIGLNGRVYPSLALAAVMMATATANADLRVVPPNRASLAFGPRTVRLDGKSNLLLRFRGPKRTFPYISAVDVMTGDTSLSAIQDRIVFVGTTALGNREVVATPIDTLFVGVEVQATVADNLLQQDFVYRPANALTLESLAVVGLGVPIALLGVTFGLVVSALTGLAALAMLWTGAIWLLSASGAFLSPLYPTAGIVVAVLSVALGKIGLERRRADVAIRKVENTVLNR